MHDRCDNSFILTTFHDLHLTQEETEAQEQSINIPKDTQLVHPGPGVKPRRPGERACAQNYHATRTESQKRLPHWLWGPSPASAPMPVRKPSTVPRQHPPRLTFPKHLRHSRSCAKRRNLTAQAPQPGSQPPDPEEPLQNYIHTQATSPRPALPRWSHIMTLFVFPPSLPP